jgi:caspase domain-containing protein
MKTRRRALIVGIDHYEQQGMDLECAVADACAMESMLRSNQDGTANYDCLLWADRTDTGAPITRAALRKAIEQLFKEFRGDVLFYFSGHGSISATGGWLVTYDGSRNDWGVSMDEILKLALQSQVNDILLIFDCCHAGDFANWALQNRETGGRAAAVLREDMTFMASSMPREVSLEASGHGLFTSAVLSALEGGAADTMGWVTAPSIHAYVERRFGGWSQQPVYKSHATQVNVIRQCAPLIERLKLERLVKEFPSHDFRFQLSPEFEPEEANGELRGPICPEKVELALLFKDYRDAGLLKPTVPGEQLYWTALRSNTVELTPRGKEYWWLVKEGKI